MVVVNDEVAASKMRRSGYGHVDFERVHYDDYVVNVDIKHQGASVLRNSEGFYVESPVHVTANSLFLLLQRD